MKLGEVLLKAGVVSEEDVKRVEVQERKEREIQAATDERIWKYELLVKSLPAYLRQRVLEFTSKTKSLIPEQVLLAMKDEYSSSPKVDEVRRNTAFKLWIAWEDVWKKSLERKDDVASKGN